MLKTPTAMWPIDYRDLEKLKAPVSVLTAGLGFLPRSSCMSHAWAALTVVHLHPEKWECRCEARSRKTIRRQGRCRVEGVLQQINMLRLLVQWHVPIRACVWRGMFSYAINEEGKDARVDEYDSFRRCQHSRLSVIAYSLSLTLYQRWLKR